MKPTDPRLYAAYKLPLHKKRALLEDARDVSRRWWVDILDCKKSFVRQRIAMGWAEIMSKLTDPNHFIMIYRKPMGREPAYFDIGFSTLSDPGYFLWIEVDPEKAQVLIEKYNL